MAKRITDGTEQTGESSPMTIMAKAVEAGADVAVIEQLLALQERYDANEAKKAYVAAMAGFKSEAPAIINKDSQVDFSSQKGRTHYKHATLGNIVSQITPILSKYELSLSWETDQAQGGNIRVTCHVTHSMGHRESVSLNGPPDDSGNKNRIQMIGSSVTYLQRYTMLAALGLATAEMDDADCKPRGPISMPTVTPPTADAPKTTARQKNKDGDDNAATDEVTGIIEKVLIKKSGANAKKPWTRYGIVINDISYGSFDDEIGKLAESLKGEEVTLVIKDDGKYKTIVEIRAPKEQGEEPEAESQADGQGELPMDGAAPEDEHTPFDE